MSDTHSDPNGFTTGAQKGETPPLPGASGYALAHELALAERKAWDSLARYKFQMFGYWAAIWVHLNRIGQFKRRNPWSGLVVAARAEVRS